MSCGTCRHSIPLIRSDLREIQTCQDTSVLWHIQTYLSLIRSVLWGIKTCQDTMSCGKYYSGTASRHLPGIPGYKCPVAHFLSSKQIPKVAHVLHLPFSIRVRERLIWVFLLVSGRDISQNFLGFFDFSLQQQIPRRFWNIP